SVGGTPMHRSRRSGPSSADGITRPSCTPWGRSSAGSAPTPSFATRWRRSKPDWPVEVLGEGPTEGSSPAPAAPRTELRALFLPRQVVDRYGTCDERFRELAAIGRGIERPRIELVLVDLR